MAQPPETISPPEKPLFSVRIVTLDYYMASPILDLDICCSSFHGRTVKEVPVIRIYGATPAGQKTCLHIHRALPFLYIPCPELLQSSQEGIWLCTDLNCASCHDEVTKDQGVSIAKTQRIHGYSLVRAKKIYGYHSSEDLFLKIYFYYPHDIARAATMLLNGSVLGRTFQPYESHIPYLLHFLIDYNLYGMSHVHTSKIKFRPPLPDSFQQRTAYKKNDTQAGLGKEAVGDSVIWLSSTVSSSLIWPDPVISQCSSETLLANFPKRQSICELEGDASVDDILNGTNMIFTSVTKTKSEVMMIQSLIPIWEEFSRSGVQEVAKPIEIMRPHPEHVLKTFQRGIQCENVLSELFARKHKSLPENVLASDVGEQLEEHIELHNGIAESLKLRGQQESKYSSCEPLNDHEVDTKFHGLPYEGQGVRAITSEFYESTSSKRTTTLTSIGTENEKSLSNEALGLLSWFASSQAAEDLNMDDEPIQEAILTPLSSMKSYKEALDVAHLDYEHASQQECNDILDSVEYVFNPDVTKEHSSPAGYHEPMTGASSGDTIPQADGSSDDSYRTPPNCNSEVNVGSSEAKTSTGADLPVMNTSVRFNKYKRRNCLWDPLPFSSTQKKHAYYESSLSPDDLRECDEISGSSRSYGNRTCHNTSNTVADTSGGMPLTSCSVRELMRRKRHYRVGFTEPERTFEAFSDAETNKKKQLSSEGSPTFHHVVLHNDIQMNTPNTQNAREKFHDAHTSSYADYATMLPLNDCRTLGISTSYPNNGMHTAPDMGKRSMEFVELTFRKGPPSKDQVTYLLGDSADATGNATVHSELLVFDVNSMNTDLHGMKDLLHFFERDLKHKKLYQSPDEIEGCELQESALGIPTHFQNDGSILYLLSRATSPPSVDSVCQWLLEAEQGKCLKNSNEESHPSTLQSSLKLLEGFEETGKELDCHLHKTAKGDSNCITGTDCCEDLIPARNVPLLMNQDMPTLHQYHLGNEPIEDCVHSDASLDEPNLSCIYMEQNFPDSSLQDMSQISDSSLQDMSQISDMEQNFPDSILQDMSQISGPDDKSFLTPLSQIGFRDPASVDGEQQLTIMSVEVLAESRGNLRPDPQFDGINIISLAVQEDTSIALTVYVLIRAVNDEPQCYRDKVTGCNISIFNEEKHLLNHFVKIIYSVDPDIVMGWEIQGGSLGFIAERASHLGINLIKSISRTPDHELKKNIGDTAGSALVIENSEASIANTVIQDAIVQEDWVTHASGLHVGGRIVLNIWRLMRNEVKLNMYSVEAVAEEVLRRKIPSIPYKVLNHCFSTGPGQLRHRSIQYLIERTKLNLQILVQLDMINRTSELARIFGIDFFSVLSRGSQFRVESMLLRLAHAQNYLAISPGHQQVASQPAMECLPLVMEPESGFYEDPVVVLDFQALYPSMMIAYNLCFSTCLGKVVPSKSDVLGVSSYSANLYLFKDSNELLLAPNGVMYVPSKVRKGVLPRLLEEILSTRIMIKQAMKKLKPSQQLLQRIFNARQLALKLIANVTYGYTAAGFTGRMPCAELADSIVQCGRRTLEEAISFVNENPKWKAKVIYGDTDSMFVLLKGRNLEAAFGIGTEIANAITSINPEPVTLKLEKVYQPCFLLTKKRYVGYSYDGPGQEKPKFDAKGIETVRRDTCPAVAKLLETSIRLIFESPDVSRVKSYLWRQWTRILSGRVSLQDFIFAKEVHLGNYSTRISSLPPAAIVAIKAMNSDPRSEPRPGERVPYVVVHGEPGARLMDMVIDPHDLLEFDSPYRLNDHYYIKKQIIPALQRVVGLLGADLNQWFLEMPRPIKRLAMSHLGSSHDFDFNGLSNSRKSLMKSRIDTYFSSKHCLICGNLVQSSKYLCDKCLEKKPLVATVIVGKTSMLERDIQHLAALCRHCGGGDWIPENVVQCNSLACSIFYERRKVQKELQVNSTFAVHAGLYPTCTAEWF